MDRYQAMEMRRAEVHAMLHPDGGQPLGGSGGSAGAELASDVSDMMLTVIQGGVYGRPQLDIKTRAICTVAALIATDGGRYLENWIGNALNVGWSKDEIVEVISQLAFYCGVPYSVNAYDAAKAVFDARGL